MATHFVKVDPVDTWTGAGPGRGTGPARLQPGLVVGGPAAAAKRREYAFYAITKNGGFLVACGGS